MILSIDEIRDKIRPICEKYKVEKVWLFGSYARGEAREDSDVDFYVKTAKEMRFLELGGLYADLEEVLGKEVDMITRIPEEYKIFKKYVERDEILIYDSKREGCTDPPTYRQAL
ncbi:nucleotidyltransferase domain protein [Selenomonas noxia ATCC 43541]|jgi:hypothetical protein|uniref:nucleotidyltransferase family protein n=1 Tax=Selenomonas noxia TaxID=135083 RepID=UPI0001BCD641|nr:nucleotidyltransferase domain-containing protein [Selenomonas noxia]EFF67111.1 nucleotidyltransferase domain protein [Selenomonas noxia ATCC 43541]